MLNFLAAIHGTGVAASTNSYESIATTTVGAGGTSTITFSSIPSTYTHLQIRAIARTNVTTDSDFLVVKFNSDGGNNYSAHQIRGNGSNVAVEKWTSYSSMVIQRTATDLYSSNIFSGYIIDVLDYQNANKYKTTKSFGAWDSNGSGEIWFNSGNWMSTSAINSITITSVYGASYNQYSQFALYGIKG